MPLPQILDYLDYREYLKDALEAIKPQKPWVSYRFLGQRLALDAGNFVKVLQKERHLPIRCVPALAGELGLNLRETEYLGLLVEFGKASSPKKSKTIYERILDLKYVRPLVVGRLAYSFYRDWKPTAVLALLHLDGLRGGEAELASQLDPKCTLQEIHDTLNLLKDLGLVRQEKGQRWVPNHSLLTTGEQWKDIAIREYQHATIKLADRALDQIAPDQRDITTATVTLGEGDLARIKELATEFRRTILQLASQCASPNRVYQINLQFFPLTRPLEGAKP